MKLIVMPDEVPGVDAESAKNFHPRSCLVRRARGSSERRTARDRSDESLRQEERDDERVDRDRFREAKTDQHRREDRPADLGVPADRLHRLADAVADTRCQDRLPRGRSPARRPNASTKTLQNRQPVRGRHAQ